MDPRNSRRGRLLPSSSDVPRVSRALHTLRARRAAGKELQQLPRSHLEHHYSRLSMLTWTRSSGTRRMIGILIVASAMSAALAIAVVPIGVLPFARQDGMGEWDLVDPTFTGASSWKAVLTGELRIIHSRVDLPPSRAFALAEHPFATSVNQIEWDGAPGVEDVPAPSWSVQATDWSDQWDADTKIFEVGVGWPMRFLVLRRAVPADPTSWALIPPRGKPPSVYDAFDFIWHIRWWALLVNIAIFVPIVLALRKGPWAALWLRRYLRRRRGLCVACAYPVRGLALCPECGKRVGGAESGVAP